ncbi:hypothetical protein GALL_144340 [mine drainage metagenome]|uniref:Uncharacterized protein n=1 Tax=mine drainage metagenome TaxID=410659 RepID=A0A1J5S5K7_9ZZZZ
MKFPTLMILAMLAVMPMASMAENSPTTPAADKSTAAPAAASSERPAAKANGAATENGKAAGKANQTEGLWSPAFLGFIGASGAMTIFLFFALVSTTARLKDDKDPWKLSEALSEEASGQLPAAAGTKPALVPSSSRLIAFLGMLALIGVTIGVAYGVLWGLFFDKDLAQLDKIGSFLTSAAVIFVPYAANQIKAAVAAVAGK